MGFGNAVRVSPLVSLGSVAISSKALAQRVVLAARAPLRLMTGQWPGPCTEASHATCQGCGMRFL